MIRMKDLTESAIDILRRYVSNEHNGVVSRAAHALSVPTPTLRQWLERKRSPNLDALSPIFAQLGVTFSTPDPEPDKDVCFVNAKIAPIGEGITPPQSEDYIAAPMVGEVGAGLGYIPQDEVKSWFLAYRHHPAVRFRRNLIAVEI